MKKRNEDNQNIGEDNSDERPAEALEFINRLLERLHQADYINHGSKIEVVYVASGGQHVETQVIAYPGPPKGSEELLPNPPQKGREYQLPDELSTEEAMVLWEKVQKAGYVDANYQPLLSRSQSALLADEIAERFEIKEKWKTFETLWNRRNMYRDYHDALNQRQSLQFRDKLRELFR